MLNVADCTATVKAKPCLESPDPAVFTELTVKIQHPQLGKVASLYAQQIDLGKLRTDSINSYTFHQIMEPEEEELATLSRVLWDKHGDVRPWLVEDEKFKGTGCWGRDDLNASKRIYIFHVFVDEKVKGQGLESVAIKSLLQSRHVDPDGIVIAWPCPPPPHDGETSEVVFDQQLEEEAAFYRQHGFRRIGLTQFFGHSAKPNHPSRNISVTEDAPHLRVRREASARATMLEHQISGALATRTVHWNGKEAEEAAYAADYPLHDAILRTFDEKIEAIIHDAHAANPTSIRQKDKNGFTPLHCAAEVYNAHAVKLLLDLGVHDDLLLRDNADLKTPLMLCEHERQLRRDLQEARVDFFNGYPAQSLRVEAMLKRAMGLYAGTDDEYVRRNTWGCTCGKCIAGWLSPKVRQALRDRAATAYDLGQDTCEWEFTEPRQPLGAESIGADLALPYIPTHLHRSIYKTFYLGFYSVFDALALVFTELSDADQPTAAEICRQASLKLTQNWTRAVAFYFEKGGKIEYALDCIVDLLPTHFEEERLNAESDEEDLEMCADDPGMAQYDEMKKALPECANDREFKMIRTCMEFPKMGPYTERNLLSMDFQPMDMGTLLRLRDEVMAFADSEDEDEDDSDEDY